MLNYSEIMKTLEEQMSFYAAYHQDARNKATHFIGVPAIVLSLMIPLSWLRIDAVSAAMVITAALLAYYLALDVWLGLAMCVVMGALLWRPLRETTGREANSLFDAVRAETVEP